MKGCRPFSDRELDLVLGSFSGKMALRNRALFLLGIRSGFRISEMLSLRLGAVLQFGQVVETVTLERRSTKGRIVGRTQVLHAAVRQALMAWIQEISHQRILTSETPLFISRSKPTSPISRFWVYTFLKRIYQANGMAGKLATHSMRKTFADRFYTGCGRDVRQTQIALGHKSLSSTGDYLSFRQEDVDRVILAMGADGNQVTK